MMFEIKGKAPYYANKEREVAENRRPARGTETNGASTPSSNQNTY